MNITVAITNYNAKNHLERILPQVRAQGFDDIVVLDDASTDGSVPYLEQHGCIRLVGGETNLGPTGNKNRILGVDTAEFILFLDVDMELRGSNVAETLEKEFAGNPQAAVIGALILSGVDEPMWFNWGYDFNPYRSGAANALMQMVHAHGADPGVMETVRRIAAGKVAVFEPTESRNVDWVSGAFFAVRTPVFRELGGFDPNFRMFYEEPDYCRRVRQAGHTVRFTTAITVKHLDLRSGSEQQRASDNSASSRYYFRKHYGLSSQQLAQLFQGA
jgi:GT2 family glycosyltransferase